MKRDRIRDRILGCWMGKGIGGTLGLPFEGCAGPLDVSLDDMSETMLPNDDLDLQLLWLHVMEKQGLDTRATHLAQAAADHYICYPDEYGVARWNTARGFEPPLTGLHNNVFGDGMGAAIRSEIWACVAPGRPDLAAALAREDALVDHHGNGVWAEMFLAALESSLFTHQDLNAAIGEGLQHIPKESRLARALHLVIDSHEQGLSWEQARLNILSNYASPNFTDVCINLAFILIGLLYGEQDFERSITLAVNCGMDTDCTGATCGSILGLLLGADGLSEKLRQRAGQDVAIHPSMDNLPLPRTLDELTERTLALKLLWDTQPDGPLTSATPDTASLPPDSHEWLVIHCPLEDSMSGEPVAVVEAEQQPELATAYRNTFNSIHLDLTDRVQRPGDFLYLLTWIRTPSPNATRLMCCAHAGLTVWLDGQEIINYHGRREPIPAFHRTEAGATVPVKITPNHLHAIKIRLICGAAPYTCTLALGDDLGRYIHPVSFEVPHPKKRTPLRNTN